MPDHIEQVDAPVAFEHRGARIYNCFRSDDIDCGTLDYWFSTDSDSREDHIPPTFDFRQLAEALGVTHAHAAGERLEDWRDRVLVRAIESDYETLAKCGKPDIAAAVADADTLLEWNAENYPGIDRRAEPPESPFPFPTVPYSLSDRSAFGLVTWLVSKSQWFEFTPLPDDRYRVVVKQEMTEAVDVFLNL